eukprot:GILK01003973.1.p2 GENE.GILK01003973.1~~GILK01003973.1.p2  ORF type:complete len:134 (+),score=3.56 GILK01003973.1:62-463(+)
MQVLSAFIFILLAATASAVTCGSDETACGRSEYDSICCKTSTQECHMPSNSHPSAICCDKGAELCGDFWSQEWAFCVSKPNSCCRGIRHSTSCGEGFKCCGGSVLPCCVPEAQECQYDERHMQCAGPAAVVSF